MSVADGGVDPFDLIWDVIKSPLYHSVNTDLSDPAVAEKLGQLRDELMAEGITFDTGMGAGGRDWELDWSLKNATPDEVMSRMRDAGIPFNSEMRYEDDDVAEKPAEGIGESECYECGEMAMVIRESDDRISLACGHCGLMDGDFGSSDGVVKFDAERAGTARMVEQEQMPFEDEEVNVDLNPNGGEPDKCCLGALQLYQELTGDYSKSNPWIWSKGVEGGTDGFGEGELDCDELHSWLEWLVYDDPEAQEKWFEEDLAPKAKKVLEQWESCISEDFSGDFTASGDSFEDAWGITKFDAERAGRARVVQEQMPDYDSEQRDLNLNIGGNQGDCCESFRQRMQEIWAGTPYDDAPDFTDVGTSGWFWDETINTEDCEVIIQRWNDSIKPIVEGDMKGAGESEIKGVSYSDGSVRDLPPHYHIIKDMIEDTLQAIEEYNSCDRGGFEGVDFGGDFTASGDSFEDAWSVAKNLNPSAGFGRERCWLCEKVKDSFGRYPNLPYYPPNWKRPCDCSGEM